MKRFLGLVCTATLLAAQNGFYIEGNGGTTRLTKTSYTAEAGYNASLAVGYQADTFRFELEATESVNKINGYRQSTIYDASGEVRLSNRFVNLYYDGYNESDLVSSIGVGIGNSDIEFKDVNILGNAQNDKEISNLLTCQAVFSVGYKSSTSLTYILKYRYIATQSDDNAMIESGNIGTQILSLGLRYLF